MSGRREDCCYILHRNRAYLISMGLTEQTEDATPDDMYDCASSHKEARRLAVRMARAFDYEGAVRWRDEGSLSILTMTVPDDEQEDP